MLETRTAGADPEKAVTVKPFRVKPNVIYLKNKRDNVLLMTESAEVAKEVPECEHGYWGGFSPKRKGPYAD
jgi:hypothetical protein